MKIILIRWNVILEDKMQTCLEQMGYEVVPFARTCMHYTKDVGYASELISLISSTGASGVISNDYFPIVSMVCKSCGVTYYSWVFDSPHYTLFAAPVLYDCNRIGCFDKELTDKVRSIGCGGIFHLPLGSAGAGCLTGESEEEPWPSGGGEDVNAGERLFDCDVSFLGNLYTNEYNYYDALEEGSLLKKYSDPAVEKQIFEYQRDYLSGFWEDVKNSHGEEESESAIEEAYKIIDREKLWPGEEYIIRREDIFISSFLEKKVSVEERHRLLGKLAEKCENFRLYTASDTSGEPLLDRVNHGPVSYDKEMPGVFRRSRININISLRSIHSGIPLRAIDIMAEGGFLLSNYQRELAELFEEGREMALYYSAEDCLEKIQYYLEHEDERERIARAGCRAVHEKLAFDKQLSVLLGR